MEKTIILTYQNGTVCSVLRVANYDGQFGQALAEAEHDWNATEDGCQTDYDSFVAERLAEKGYEVRMDEEYEVIMTCM